MEDDELKIPTNVQLFPTEDLLNNFLNKKRKSSNDELSSSCYTERDFGITSNYNIYSKYFLLDTNTKPNAVAATPPVASVNQSDRDSETVEQMSYHSCSVDTVNQKKKLFKTLRDMESEQKQKKLLLNRISAKKSRTKKKNYVLKLEEELKQIKREIAEMKRRSKTARKRSCCNNNNNTTCNKQQERKSNTNSNSMTNRSGSVELVNAGEQKVSVFHNMVQLLRLAMPISLKVYKERFLKMEEFDLSCETVDMLVKKNNRNIHILNELYSFEHATVNVESIAYKLYAFYIKVGNLLNAFKQNYELL